MAVTSLTEGVPRTFIISIIYSRPDSSPGKSGMVNINSANTHPTDQISILCVYSIFPNISSGAR
jgi:hypothetical protein